MDIIYTIIDCEGFLLNMFFPHINKPLLDDGNRKRVILSLLDDQWPHHLFSSIENKSLLESYFRCYCGTIHEVL